MDVEELLVKKGLEFVPRGRDLLIKCLNPDHEDSNPSLSIDKITGIFKCFSCGIKGNIFFYYGEKGNKLQIRKELLKRTILEKRAQNIGLKIPSLVVPFQGSWRGISEKTYKHFEAFEHHDSDFIGRINFPIRDRAGKIVAFIGRHTGDVVPKYKVHPAKAKTPLYPSKVVPVQGRIILVEGIFDVINLYDKGITNAVCCFGTSNVTESKLKVLKMSNVQGIDIFFDGDTAGKEGAEKVKILCDNVDLKYRNIYLEGSDPGSLSQRQVAGLKRKLYEE